MAVTGRARTPHAESPTWPSLVGARVVITGAAGFIGRTLLQALLTSGASSVVAIDVRSLSNIPFDEHQRCEVVICERSILLPLDDVLDGADIVFHLAAQVGTTDSIHNPHYDAVTNVQGTIMLLEACRRVGVRRIVYSSSAAVYGAPVYLPIDEKHPTAPSSPYGLSKLTAERYCLLYGELYDLSVAALRYFNVYGPHQTSSSYAAVIPLFLRRVARNEPLTIEGDGYQTRDFVHVQDVVRANLLAATSHFAGVLNIGSGRATSIRELAALIGGPSYPIEFVPARAGDIPYSVAAIGAAYAAIGYTPTISLEQGLRALRGTY